MSGRPLRGDVTFKKYKAYNKWHFTADTPQFFVCLTFNPIHQNSCLKTITLYFRIHFIFQWLDSPFGGLGRLIF
jgi:hypothetical protein